MSRDEWPEASPDLNPLDYAIWAKLENMACSKPHTSVEDLKKYLLREWKRLPIESVRAAIEDWRPRLNLCVKPKGGHFEN